MAKLKIHSSYLKNALYGSTRKYIIFWLMETIEKLDFDFIAVTGTSGLLVGVTISDLVNKPLVIVRKKDLGEESHSSHKVEYVLPEKDSYKYIIIDDLIFSGDTLVRIKENIDNSVKNSECISIFIYSQIDSLKDYALDYINESFKNKNIIDIIHILREDKVLNEMDK